MKFLVRYSPKPIPDRRFDFEAVVLPDDENNPVGFGRTAEAAIADLKEEIAFRNEG